MYKTAVIGAGLMGSGIAIVYSAAGYQVMLFDFEEVLKKSLENIKNILAELSRLQILKNEDQNKILERISMTTSLEDAVKDAEIVTEAVSESLELKINLFKQLDEICGKEVILASNTSSFKISEIAQRVNRKQRVVGTHWWNPPYLMPLVEIIRTDFNSEIIERVVNLFTKTLKKQVVVCKDSPGGVGVRLQAALFAEAMKIYDEGLVSASDLDKIVKLTLGMRYPLFGPFQIADLGGLDVFLHAHDYLSKRLGERFTPIRRLVSMVENGELGVKTGKGFYTYPKDYLEKVLKKRNETILEILRIQSKFDV